MTVARIAAPNSSRSLDEERLEALLRLARMTEESPEAVCDLALEEAVRLTQSQYGYLAFVSDDEANLTMYAWSERAGADCTVPNRPMVYPVATTGLWGEPVRQRKPSMTNDYRAPDPAKRGIPEGHVTLTRHLGVPVIDEGRVKLVVGVANKAAHYDEADVRQLSLLMEGLWQHLRRRKDHEALRQHEQAEILARLTSGVAHDLNNMLSAIHGCLGMIKRHAGDPEKLALPLETANSSCDEALALVGQLLTLGRRAASAPWPQALNELVASTASLGRALSDPARLELDLRADSGDEVSVDPSRFKLALLNLLANARDATPPGGRIVISTSREEIPDTGVEKLHEIQPGSYLAVAVRDEGPGIEPTVRNRLFQPFFTTKAPGKGTGLGLYAVRQVMAQHGGLVTFESEKGRGATFKLLFPRAPAPS